MYPGLSNASSMLQMPHSRKAAAEPQQQHRKVPKPKPRHVEGLLSVVSVGQGTKGGQRRVRVTAQGSHHLADATMSSIMGALVQLRPTVACLYAPYSCSRSPSPRAPAADWFTARCASANALRSASSSTCVGVVRRLPARPPTSSAPDAVVSSAGAWASGWWMHGDHWPSFVAVLAKAPLLATRTAAHRISASRVWGW